MKNYFFALGYIPHRLWGSILIPQLLEKDETTMYFVTGEILLRNEQSMSYQRLTPMQKEVVNIIDEYSDKRLHKLFSKKKTVKEFQDTLNDQIFKDHIRPYIEKRLYQVIQIAAENKFKVFMKEKATQNIFSDDFLTLHRKPALPYFRFERTPENTLYKLSILRGEEKVELVQDYADVISNSPALVILNKDIYFVDQTEGKKLTPFFTKEFVTVQQSAEEKYFSTFVANTLKEHDSVETIGFDVTDSEPTRSVTLSLEMGMNNEPVWIVTLKYSNYQIHPGSSQQRFVNFKNRNNRYEFERFSRDIAWEESLEESLDEVGLKSRDRTNFTLRKWLSNDRQEKVYEAIKFTNSNCEFLAESGFEIRHKLDIDYHLGKVDLVIESTEQEDWFDLHAVVQFGKFSIPFIRLKKNILSGDRLYKLPDGTVAVIPLEWFSSYKAAFEFGHIDGESLKIHKQHFSQVDDAIRERHASTIDQLEQLNHLEELPEVKPPQGILVKMRDYQVDGFAWMWFLQQNGFGGCLADDMGLGKTLQTIALIQQNKEFRVRETNQNTPDVGQLSLSQRKYHPDLTGHRSCFPDPELAERDRAFCTGTESHGPCGDQPGKERLPLQILRCYRFQLSHGPPGYRFHAGLPVLLCDPGRKPDDQESAFEIVQGHDRAPGSP